MEKTNPTTLDFPAFSLTRLLSTTFQPRGGERICILIDLDEPSRIRDFSFLNDPSLTVQHQAYNVFYRGLQDGTLQELGLKDGDIFAYKITGGSNLDLPDQAWDPLGNQVSLEKDVYPVYDLILCVSTFSATAPLTAFAKQYNFRGATLHGLNDIIINSGLSVDYNEVSAKAEKFRLELTRSDKVEIDFDFCGRKHTLTLLCNGQEAQKSHGLCLGTDPDVANLPAGEVYFVPESAEGEFPMRYADGTIGLMHVSDGRIRRAVLVRGNQSTIDEHNRKIESDPVTGEIGELGFGTQILPVSGRDIQDEKILGTLHVATGRSDHLGGSLTPDKFASRGNATHDDILFSPTKTPEINVPQVRAYRNGIELVVIENYQPSRHILEVMDIQAA
ncbi:MAG: hypothetical protein LR011_13385 [Verrucomicrobia bacterium]|nr:hypothetical protein [Verrucomicrobiota bacterium]